MSYYLIETEYVGPSETTQEKPDAHTLSVQTIPGRANMSGEERTDGWLGTSNDWAEHAHGAFVSQAAVCAFVRHRWPENGEKLASRLLESWEDDDERIEDGIVWTPVASAPWPRVERGSLATIDWDDEDLWDSIQYTRPGAELAVNIDPHGVTLSATAKTAFSAAMDDDEEGDVEAFVQELAIRDRERIIRQAGFEVQESIGWSGDVYMLFAAPAA